MIAPPTPDRLERDKKAVDDQFERAFALIDQLAKDTETLKAAELQRTQRLDTALSELETVISELKVTNRRREDDAQRLRDDMHGLKDSVPRALETQKDQTDSRLRELNTELKSLKTLISQRINPTSTSSNVSNYLRPTSGNATPTSPGASGSGSENVEATSKPAVEEAKKQDYQDYVSGLNRNSPFNSGMQQAKASIPAWQMAMATKNSASTSSATNGTEASGSGAQ
jgi:peroxin-14